MRCDRCNDKTVLESIAIIMERRVGTPRIEGCVPADLCGECRKLLAKAWVDFLDEGGLGDVCASEQ